jgi:hypothetical protein
MLRIIEVFFNCQSNNCNGYYCLFYDKKMLENVNHIEAHNMNKSH